MKRPDDELSVIVEVKCGDDDVRSAEMCLLPICDADRKIPRGKLIDILEIEL